MSAKKNFTSCDWKLIQTLFSDSSTGYTIKILLTLLRYGPTDRDMPDSEPAVLYLVLTLRYARIQIEGTGTQDSSPP